jgi:hypothetical protein
MDCDDPMDPGREMYPLPGLLGHVGLKYCDADHYYDIVSEEGKRLL